MRVREGPRCQPRGGELFQIREGGWWEHNFSWGSQSNENGVGWGSGRAAVWGKGWGKMRANVGEFVRSVDTDRVGVGVRGGPRC